MIFTIELEPEADGRWLAEVPTLRPLGHLPGIVRATIPARLPVVLSRDEARRLLGALTGTPLQVATLHYGAGLRLSEASRSA